MATKQSLKVEIHGRLDSGDCCLTGKAGVEVFVVSTEDGFLSESPISLKGIAQLAKMKLNGNGKKAAE